MRKFLVINPFGIGDVLFTTPVITCIKENFPDSYIGYWCNERVQGIFTNDRNINKVFPLSRGDLKKIYKNCRLEGIKAFLGLLSQIRKERFDVALDYSQDHRYGLLSKLLGIKRRIGFNYRGRGRFLTDKIDIEGFNAKHMVEYYLDLLKFLDVRKIHGNMYLAPAQNCELKIGEMFGQFAISDNDLLVGIVPGAGASWGKDALLKHWPITAYAQLADKIIDDFKAKVLILGDGAERSIADKMLAAMKHEPVDLVGKLDLCGLICVVKKLRLLITNDGGPLHVAVALGKKTVSFFGPVDPSVYGPYPADTARHVVLRNMPDCSPCYVNFRLRPCRRDKECLRKIDVDQALKAAERLLN